MGVGILSRDVPQQQDGFCQHELGHASRVRKRGVEDRDAAGLGGVGVDLVGADAEATDAAKLGGGLEDPGGDPGPGSDAQVVGITDPLDQLVLGELPLVLGLELERVGGVGQYLLAGPALVGRSAPGSIMLVSQKPIDELKRAGAVLNIQTTVPEFYMTGVTWTKLWGVSRNPWNTNYAVGGSSGVLSRGQGVSPP